MKKVTRSFSGTAAAQWLARRKLFFVPLAGLWLFQLGRQSEEWPLWLGALTFVALLVFGVVAMLWETWRAGRLLRELHARLRWLAPDAVTWLQPHQVRALCDELGAMRVPMHELDGAAIHSVDELVRALGAKFGARSFPADPVARADSMLRSVAGRSRQVRVVLWHDAHVFAARDPMAFHSLLSAWLRDLPPHVLLMLVAPAPVPLVPATQPAAPPRPPIEPDVATLASAPSRAWWKPRPGELA
jgi:hypothetical protein